MVASRPRATWRRSSRRSHDTGRRRASSTCRVSRRPSADAARGGVRRRSRLPLMVCEGGPRAWVWRNRRSRCPYPRRRACGGNRAERGVQERIRRARLGGRQSAEHRLGGVLVLAADAATGEPVGGRVHPPHVGAAELTGSACAPRIAAEACGRDGRAAGPNDARPRRRPRLPDGPGEAEAQIRRIGFAQIGEVLHISVPVVIWSTQFRGIVRSRFTNIS